MSLKLQNVFQLILKCKATARPPPDFFVEKDDYFQFQCDILAKNSAKLMLFFLQKINLKNFFNKIYGQNNTMGATKYVENF